MRLAPLCLLVLSPTALAAQAATGDTILYRVSFPHPEHHEARVSVTFPGVTAETLQVRMSRSSPGRYALHEFAKNVYTVTAVDSRGTGLTITRPDPYQWDVSGHDGAVTMYYTVYGDRTDGTYLGIDRTHAHMNMPATFMWARGLEHRPIKITFEPASPAWRIATQLLTTEDPKTFTAADLQYFMDSPTELSDHYLRVWELVVPGSRTQRLRLALHHLGTDDEAHRFFDWIQRVVMEERAVFGELPRYDGDTYTFIADYLPFVNGDGMEHRNSTILTSSRALADNALRNLGTVSHEFFHSWNVERIRPKALEPFDFERANMSGELWLAEGFTSYYDDLFIRRAGLTDDSTYARGLSGTVNAVINDPGRRYFSPIEMSMQAPFVDAATSIDPQNKTNTFISYYTWGAAIGLGLDLSIRQRFPSLTLDDFMHAMWVRYGKTEIPYTLDDVRQTLAAVTGDTAFTRDFWSRYIAGREVVDYASLLDQAGFVLQKAHPGAAWLGDVRLRTSDEGLMVVGSTEVNSPLYQAGLDRGDRIITLAGVTVAAPEDVSRLLAERRPGDVLPITYESRGITVVGSITLRENPQAAVITAESLGRPVSEGQRAFRERWLGSRADAVR